MLIDYIRIKNWRSFYGDNDFFVSKDSQKNVTLIRAENGVGKTSLLAAINWCFFGLLPSDSEFENPKKLVNDYAVEHDGATRCTVEIDFEHDGKAYRAHRAFDQRAGSMHPLRLSELVDGGTVPFAQDRPDRFINSVVPKEMAPHFFFYGEATSRYTGVTGAKKFGEAVKGILGSTIARMALDDLKKVWQDYNKQASDNTSDEAREVEQGIGKAEAEIDRLNEELKKTEREIEAADARIDRLSQELAGTKPAKEAQARRVKTESQLSLKEGERARALQRSQSWMQTYITAILAEELVAEASEVIKKEDTRGKLPAPYDQKFVNELLDDGKCVCGRPITKGSIEYECIKSLLDNAGDQAVMSRVMSTSAALGRLEQRSGSAWSEFERNNEDLRRIEGEIQVLDADLVEISKDLSANPITDIAEKEAARERAKVQRQQANARKVDVKTLINNFERQRAAAMSRRDELVRKSEAARRYVKRAQLAGALMARLDNRLKDEEERARASIEREIDSIVQKFMRKPAKVKLNRDYQLQLFDERGLEIAKSTGENQLLGLAFTGALAKYAKEREKDVADILLPGTVAPLVVDSPFGHLDPLYRRSVAEFLPNLASQVILLVSTSQASDAVLGTIASKVGQEYLLTRHNRSDGEGKQPELIDIRGKTYELTRYNSQFDGTQITEVSE
jgi:DNA sulfur modification protein DndD